VPIPLRHIEISGYRSLRRVRFPVDRLTVFVGPNGSGKTNLYRALELLQAAAAGNLAQMLAAEGGMESALWTGQRRRQEPARIALKAGFGATPGENADHSYGVAVGVVHSYETELGLRRPTAAAFPLEPQIKEETLLHHHRGRARKILERRGPTASARDLDDNWSTLGTELLASETALAAIEDIARYPDICAIRRTMLDWRFYHEMRTDREAPLRRPCLAVATPTLASDGANLAAVFATLTHIREDRADLDAAIADAFPGAELVVPVPGRSANFGLIFPEHPKRVFEAAELSDGTLRYLALMGALLAYRLPAFIALNEPEASLHPDLLDALARLIVRASERTQVWLVTHSRQLAEALARAGNLDALTVSKRSGETSIAGSAPDDDAAKEDE
jgi:predicted ATPase